MPHGSHCKPNVFIHKQCLRHSSTDEHPTESVEDSLSPRFSEVHPSEKMYASFLIR